MDPDIPYPSIEGEDLLPPPLPSWTRRTTVGVDTAATATPLPPSSPVKSTYSTSRTPAQSSSPHKIARSPSSTLPYGDKQKTPTLQSRQSTSNTNASRAVTPSRTPYRRASSNLNPASPAASFKSAMSSQELPQRKVLTPSDVAKEYFMKDLELQKHSQSKVAVIVHDSCYGHRFSRPRTSKAALSSIVERPERIHATLLGASTAYVRLGGRHAQGRHSPHPQRQPPSDSVPFDIRKTSRFLALNNPSVTHVHGSKWMEELQVMCDLAEGKLAMNGKELVRPIGYGKDESGNPLPKLHEGDLYLCAETLSALQGSLGGICDAVDAVYDSSPTQRAFVCIRPPGHHCSSNVPSGFCWLNNVHVGITYAAATYGLTHAAIIDFDLHHGDGSQAITWDHNRRAQTLPKHAQAYKKTPIGYYSIHDINSFPCEAGDEEKIRNASVCLENAHGQSIWNVHFEPWKTHAEFWQLYQTRYMVLLGKARNFLRYHSARLQQTGVRPKAAIFLSAGFDASEWEMPGMQRHGVNVPTDFYAQFTADVVKMSQEEDLGVEGRVISVLEGGYSDRALTTGVLSHLCGLVDEPSVNVAMDHKGGLVSSVVGDFARNSAINGTAPTLDRYDPLWWSSEELEVIEAIVQGNLPAPPLSTKNKEAGNYSSPTHASNSRITEAARERRSLSAQLEARLSLENEAPPPPPEVDWAIASYELSRLLIPTDRQTLSCRHGELTGEATRARKERQSTIGLPADDPMQLRERRPKPPPIPASHARGSSRSSTRRTTIASVSDLPDPSMSQTGVEGPSGRPRRRSSASSGIISGFSEMKLDDESQPGASVRPTQAGAGKRPGVPAPAAKAVKAPAPRKPRAPAAANPPVKSRTSPRKAKTTSRPGSRAGSSSSDRVSTSRMPPTPVVEVSRPPQQPQNSSGNTDNTDGMDNLTSGMKKVSIKLKMPNTEEHAAEGKKVEEPSKSTGEVKGPRKLPTSRVVKPKPASRPAAISRVRSQAEVHVEPESSVAFSVIPETLSDAPLAEIHAVQAPATNHTYMQEAPLTEPVVQDILPRPQPQLQPDPSSGMQVNSSSAADALVPQATVAPDLRNAFGNPSNDQENTKPEASDVKLEHSDAPAALPAKPEGPSGAPSASTVPPTQPQNNGDAFARPLTPNKRTKNDLPKFTASSPIPFSKSSSRPGSAAGAQHQVQDEKKQENDEGTSTWDFPETPQQQK